MRRRYHFPDVTSARNFDREAARELGGDYHGSALLEQRKGAEVRMVAESTCGPLLDSIALAHGGSVLP